MDNRYGFDRKDVGEFLGLGTVVWIWIMVLAVIGMMLGGALLYGVQQNLIRRQQIHTTGYVAALVDQMSKDLTQFQKNEVELAKSQGSPDVVKALDVQQMGIVQDMWSAYDQIPQDAKDQVPNNLMQFILSHGRAWQP